MHPGTHPIASSSHVLADGCFTHDIFPMLKTSRTNDTRMSVLPCVQRSWVWIQYYDWGTSQEIPGSNLAFALDLQGKLYSQPQNPFIRKIIIQACITRLLQKLPWGNVCAALCILKCCFSMGWETAVRLDSQGACTHGQKQTQSQTQCIWI